MKEQDAKQKWCPYAHSRSVIVHGQQDNKTIVFDYEDSEFPKMKCIGSACMAWRLHSKDDAEAGGYCGLAGKP